MHSHDWRGTDLSRLFGTSLIYPAPEEHRHGSTSRSCRFLLHNGCDTNIRSSSRSLLPPFWLFLAIFWPFSFPSPAPQGLFLGSVYCLSCGKCVISLLLWVYFLKKTHLLLYLTSYFTASLEAESCCAVIYIHFQWAKCVFTVSPPSQYSAYFNVK